ncbi:MAG: alpha/beta hydrolase, partial [Bacteroidota bacterium]
MKKISCKYNLLLLLLMIAVSPLIAQTDSGFYKSFDGTKIHYETEGSGMPVLLIHGFTGNGKSW